MCWLFLSWISLRQHARTRRRAARRVGVGLGFRLLTCFESLLRASAACGGGCAPPSACLVQAACPSAVALVKGQPMLTQPLSATHPAASSHHRLTLAAACLSFCSGGGPARVHPPLERHLPAPAAVGGLPRAGADHQGVHAGGEAFFINLLELLSCATKLVLTTKEYTREVRTDVHAQVVCALLGQSGAQ